MVVITTMSYDQLGSLIRNKKVSLDNDDVFFGATSASVKKYFEQRLGSEGYVLGIRGHINKTTADLLAGLDSNLACNKVILEAAVDDKEILTFSVRGIEEVVDAVCYGLPEDVVFEQLDKAQVLDESGVQFVCMPFIERKGQIRIMSLSDDITMNVDGITCVRLKKEEK